MMKKTIVIGAAVALLLALLMGRSHVRTAWNEVKDTVKNTVSIDFELKRARQMIKDLRPEIEKNLRLIAQEEVEVAKLEKQVTKSQDQLARDRQDILRLKGDLDSGSEVFVYAGRSYTAKEVKSDLTSRFEQFKTQEATAEALNKILLARQQSLQAAREKLDSMLDAKRQLEVDVENLEARLAMVEVAQTSSEFRFDDSQLSRTQQLLDDIGTRIEVAERLVNVNSDYATRIPLEDDSEAERDITDEVAEYFSTSLPEIEAYVNSTTHE
jgi:chromosome segregation ATPase